MPISQNKYQSIISKFIDKWGTVISSIMLDRIQKLWNWVKNYESEVRKRSPYEQKLYIKRGVNLLAKLTDQYQTENADLEEMLLKCRLAILKGTGVCSEKTKRELSHLIFEYNKFIEDLIGCQHYGSEFILGLLRQKNIQHALGEEYTKIQSSLEDECLTIRIRRFRQF